ncbi:SH3 domain-containing protein [Arenibacter nanhaiticus]|uniref:SH3 domain-containing protein n=2 Tax=Arenibacter nanhaiticus TaxID=558155 RepID=A0A1M6D078_9FLAO|nr:SH3 domain-containing protein [Arenibacter nanhaiticus]
MKRGLYILFFLICSLGISQNQDLFNQATSLYNEGKFDEAAEKYLAILENGEHSAELYFNLGNTYYKLNEIAPSIFYYEKALLLNPNDGDVKNNLAFAQNMTLDDIETLPQAGISRFYKTVTSFFSFDQWAYLAVIFMILFVALYILFYFLAYAAQKRVAFISALVFFVFSIGSFIFAYVQYSDFEADQPAIVFAEEISIKSEPNARSQEVFVLHAGTKVNVLNQLNDWKKIALINGKTGWVPAEEIKDIKDF